MRRIEGHSRSDGELPGVDTILIVDDEVALVDSLRFLLEQHYRVVTAATGTEALLRVEAERPVLVLLDVMLPGMDGFEVCRTLRGRGYEGQILLLTARDQEIDSVLGLELGADDYVTKPFRHRELLARIKARLRQRGDNAFRAGALELYPERHEALLRGQRLELTPKEFALLLFLVENRRRAQSRERIVEAVWGYDFDGEDRVVNVTVQRLREKLDPDMIVTVRGTGYMFDVQ
jgi:two-component system alkaline phosphatase synthesis response regulator PhoP